MRFVRSCVGVVCAILLIVPSVNAQSAAAPTTTPPYLEVLRSIESQVSTIRGLSAVTEPGITMLDQSSLHNYLVGQLDKDYLPSEREADQKELVILGLIKPSDDVVQLQLSLLSGQVIGIYDSDAKALIVVSDQGTLGPGEKMTFAHEFNHALQDQHYDLNRLAPKHSDNADRSLAVHALVEGDAIMLQTLWAGRNLSAAELSRLASLGGGSDDSLARVPLIMRAELLFPYVEGFNFVRAAYRQSGSDYGSLDTMFKNPPVSTAQVLHMDKYRDQVLPVDVQLPDIAAAMGSDWRRVGSGVLGELDTRVLLEQWGSNHPDAVRVAGGWAGDRWQLVEKDGRTAIVLKSTWDSPQAAQDFFDGYTRGLRARFEGALAEDVSSTREALTTGSQVTDVRIQGSDVIAVIAFDRATADAMVDLVQNQTG